MNAPTASRIGVEAKAHKRKRRQRDERGHGDRVDAADLLRQMAEDEAAGDGAQIGDDDDPADRPGIEIVLLLQEGRIEILRAVAEQVEAHHQHDHVDDQSPMLGDRLPQGGLRMRLRRLEGWRFWNAAADEQHEESGQDAEQEHRPPADRIVAERSAIEQAIGDRGEQEAGRVAALQNPGHQSPRPRRNGFHRERAAEAPFAAHGDAEQARRIRKIVRFGEKAASAPRIE